LVFVLSYLRGRELSSFEEGAVQLLAGRPGADIEVIAAARMTAPFDQKNPHRLPE